jgi:hypothetical protein
VRDAMEVYSPTRKLSKTPVTFKEVVDCIINLSKGKLMYQYFDSIRPSYKTEV